MVAAAEIRERDLDDVVVPILHDQGQLQLDIAVAGVLGLEVPLPGLAPAEPDRALRHHHLAAAAVDRHGLPVRVVGLAEPARELRGAHQAVGEVVAVLLHQPDQHRHVGVAPAVVLEILGLPVNVELAQDHVAHGHRQGGVGALLRAQPQVGKLGGLGIVRAHHHALGALVPDLGVEMRVGCAGLRDVRAPQDQEAGIVPVGTLRHVGLLAPGLRAGRWQVAVPVVERHADSPEQRQIAGAGGVGDHRHRRDRREPDHPVGTIGLGGVGIGGSDDLVDLVPAGAHEAAETAPRDVGPALARVLDDRGPGGDRWLPGARLAPELEQRRAHQRVLHPVAGIHVPAVAGAPGAAARLVVRQVRPGARIVGLLGLPGDDPALDVDLPGARAGAVRAVRRAHDLVVLPALAVAVLPAPILAGGDAVTVGERLGRPDGQEVQTVEEMTHWSLLTLRGRTRWACPSHRARCRGAGRPAGCRRPRSGRRR